MSDPYLSFIGMQNKKCCHKGPNGIEGPTGMDGISGLRGIIGMPGCMGSVGPTGHGCTGPTGSGKTFIVDHPIHESKYLIHACLEGPEAGVYYRGKATIENNEFVIIKLPDYVESIAYNLSVQITSIYFKERLNANIYESTEIENNEFKVYGNNGSFYWSVYGTKDAILVEPEKSIINIQGDENYKWY